MIGIIAFLVFLGAGDLWVYNLLNTADNYGQQDES